MFTSKGFSLVWLAAFLAFLVVLSVLVVWVVKPAKLLEKNRDQVRVEELEILEKAINLYITNNGSTVRMCEVCKKNEKIFAHQPVSLTESVVVLSSRSVNSTGWIPVDLSLNAGIRKTPVK